MGIYEKYVLPKLLNLAMKAPALNQVRRQLVPLARGNVLEIGIGSGLNLPYYDQSVSVTGVDPSLELQAYAREVADESGLTVEFLALGGERLPVDDNSFDTVVMTWTLCTIPDPAPDEKIARWQARLNPMWKVIGGGCNLNRRIDRLYQDAGFRFDDMQTGYLEGPKFATYNYRGLASVA